MASCKPIMMKNNTSNYTCDGNGAQVEVEEFWRRKEKELAFLERYTGSVQGRTPSADFEAFRHSVRALRKRILLQQVEKTALLPETSPVGLKRFLSPGGPVMYGYQRYDLRRVDIDWLKELYFASKKERFADGLFLACGMSAITALFSIFVRRDWKKVQFSPVPYFESNLLAKRFFAHITFDQTDDQFSSDRDVLWLDTSSLSWPTFPERAGSIRLVVIDTTCVEPDSEHILRWLHESARLRCPLALVRSHMKLDSFGLELGRLGSAVVIAPDDNTNEIEELVKELLQARSGFGTGFNLVNLYPWLGNPEFASLSRSRTTAMRQVIQRLHSALLEARKPTDRFEMLPTTHGIFLVIQTHLGVRDNENRQDCGNPFQSFALSRRIAEICGKHGLPVIAAGSFGLDQITINDFVNLNDGQHQVRVSGADIPLNLIPSIAANIRHALVNLAGVGGGTPVNP